MYTDTYGRYGYATAPVPDPGRDTYKAEHLQHAERNAQIGEGKYLCARCGAYSVSVECRTCRRIYCDRCSFELHGPAGTYRGHKLRDFDPNYEANKRAAKRGTKFDTTAPAPALLSIGEPLSRLPMQSKLAILLTVIAIVLGLVSSITHGWTLCTHTNPDWRIGIWRTCWDKHCEGTLYFWDPLPCPHDKFKVPVNFVRAFVTSALFFNLVGIIVLLVGQKGVGKSIVMLKTAAGCGFIAAGFYILATSLWMFVTLGDVECNANQLIPINVYGPAGHCQFSYAWYLAWLAAGFSFVVGMTLFDWWRGLPILTKLAVVILTIVQVLIIISIASNYWFIGDFMDNDNFTITNYLSNAVKAWGGIWRTCNKFPDSPNTDSDYDHYCQAVALWKYKDWTDNGNCLSKSRYHGMRAVLIVGICMTPLLWACIFHAHAFRKPQMVKKIGTLIAFIIFVMFLTATILWPVTLFGHYDCGTDTLPFCTENCKLGWSWILCLIATILSFILIPLFFKMRVGFEVRTYLDQDGKVKLHSPPGPSANLPSSPVPVTSQYYY